MVSISVTLLLELLDVYRGERLFICSCSKVFWFLPLRPSRFPSGVWSTPCPTSFPRAWCAARSRTPLRCRAWRCVWLTRWTWAWAWRWATGYLTTTAARLTPCWGEQEWVNSLTPWWLEIGLCRRLYKVGLDLITVLTRCYLAKVTQIYLIIDWGVLIYETY